MRGLVSLKFLLFFVFAGSIVGLAVAKNAFTDAWLGQNVNVFLSFDGNGYFEDDAVLSFDMETKYNSTALYDFSFNDNYGVNYGASEGEDGYFGKSLRFNEDEEDNVTISHSEELGTNVSYTIMFWGYFEDTTVIGIMFKGSSTAHTYGLFTSGGSALYMDFHKASNGERCTVLTPTGFVEQDTWVHYAVTFDVAQSNISIWKNAEINTTVSYAYATKEVAEPLIIGAYLLDTTDYYMHGYLDEVRIFDSALTQEEIVSYMDTPIEMVNDVSAFDGDVVGLYLQNGSLYEQQVVSGEVACFDVFDIQNESIVMYKVAHDSVQFASSALVFHVGDDYSFNVVAVYSSDMITVAVGSVFFAVGVVWLVKRWVG